MRWPPSALLTAQLGKCAGDSGREIFGVIWGYTGVYRDHGEANGRYYVGF